MDIKNKSQFIEYFSKGIKSQNNLKIGVEHERFLFEGENKKRISFETLKKLFENLKFNGWKPLYEKEIIIGMQRDIAKKPKVLDVLNILSEFPAKPAIIAPTIITDEIALVTDIKGV